MANSMKIKLIKIFSPCEFYFQFMEGNLKKQQDAARNQVARIEKRIKHEVSKNPLEDAENGRIVACFMNSWNRWVRAKVINRYHNGDFEVLFIDYGIKMDMRRIFNLPAEFQVDYKLVMKGSLGIAPAEYWSESVVKLCKDLTRKKDLQLRFVLTCRKDDLYIGDIFVFSSTGNYSFTEKLRECDEKISSEANFQKIYETLTSASLPKPSYPHEKIQVNKELDLASISQILLHQNNFVHPSDLIIRGKGLKAQWKNVEETLFDSCIKRQMAKLKMANIQSFMWPQMHSSYRHAIIISSQPDLTSLYLSVVLNNVLCNPFNRAMGPIAIIFAADSTKASEISKMCENTVKNFKIVKAVGLCDDKKGEIINGCDILVTTPSAFTRLTNNISLKIIDVNRLKHIAFDSFHLISSKYENDVNRIMKFCLADCDKVPQIIVTSRMFRSEIKHKFMNQLPREKTVVCFDSFIEAAVCAGMEIKLDICENFEEKVKKLNSGNLKNAVIIANDVDLKERLTDKSVSIMTDSSLEISNIKHVENLVNFSAAKNWKSFVDRFKLISGKILDKLDGMDVKLTTAVLFEDHEIVQFEALMTFMADRKLFHEHPKMIEKIRFIREQVKCEKSIKLCTKLLQFGECKNHYCADRHILLSIDKFLDTFTNNYIKFDIISSLSPVEFIIKVKQYCKNGQWVSLLDEIKEIETKLNVDLQTYCNNGFSLDHGEGKIGKIYAKNDNREKRWVRVKIVERCSPTLVTIYHIDQCISSHALESQLAKIPSEISSLRPLNRSLRIFNLVPLDGDNNYSSQATDKFKIEINRVCEKLVFTCRVQMALNDLLFADNFEAKNSRGALKFRLVQTHLNLGLSEIDHEVGKKLKMFARNETDFLEADQSKPDLEIRKAKEQKITIETWKELKCGESYSVTFSHYTSPYSFFVVVDASENFVLKKWMKKFEVFADLKALENSKAGSSCMLTHNGINKRAKILSINENEVQLFLVDFGEIVNEKKSLIFELPDEFKKFRYQAVHCSLKGIKPKFNMKFWPPLQKTVIYNLIKDRDWNLKVFGKNTKQHELNGIYVNSYEVFLFDSNNEYLHEIAIQNSYACQDGSFEMKIAQDSSDEDTSESCEENVSESYDTMTFGSESEGNNKTQSESGYRTNESEQNAEELPSFNLEGLKAIKEFFQSLNDAEHKNSEVKPEIKVSESNEHMKPSLLTNLFKHPHIEWRQNKIYIYLIINAKDCTDYSITLDECTADIAIVYAEKIERAVLQLYGLITPKLQLCSHSLNGGNVILRLAKRAINREWPRLTQEKSNSTYIKFSDEEVPYIPIEIVETSKNVISRPAGLSDDEEDESSSDSKFFSSDED